MRPASSRHSSRIKQVLESATYRMMVGHGLGFALLATKPASAMTYDGRALVTRPLRVDTGPNRVVLAHRRGTALSKAGDTFARLCRDFFSPDSARDTP
jgi:DNA-binding transcriptional LysR family regulator